MRFLQLLCLAGALATALNAGTIAYDNIGESSAGADGVDFAGPLYDSFTSGTGDTITAVQLILSGDDTSSGAVDVDLYSDNSIAPGELIAVLGVINDSALSDTPAVYDVPLTVAPPLADDTVYWVGLSGTTSAQWYYDGDSNGIGVAGESFANQTGVYSDSFDPYQMQVAMQVTESPEPASSLLIAVGAGVAGVLVLLRRRS